MRLDPIRPARRHRLNLTPMIDVVLLLLVFFMIVSRFGGEGAVPLTLGAGQGAAWQGPPRLVDVGAAGALRLNGQAVADGAGLVAALGPLMPAPDAPVVLRAGAGADVQHLINVMAQLRAAGIARLILAQP